MTDVAVKSNESLVLPKVSDGSFLVNSEYNDNGEEEDLRQKTPETSRKRKITRPDRHGGPKSQPAPRSKFAIRSKRDSVVFSKVETNNSFVPKTVSGGTTVKPNGFARRMAETRSQDILSVKKPSRSVKNSDRPSESQANKPTASTPENGIKDNESLDSGIATGEKNAGSETKGDTATSPETQQQKREPSNLSTKSSNRKSNASSPTKPHHASRRTSNVSKPPPSRTKNAEPQALQKEDSGLSDERQTHSQQAQMERGLFYDKQGNLVSREKRMESVMSDPMLPKLHNTETELRKIYVEDASLLVKREDKLRKQREAALQRPETMLSRREANLWDSIHGVYGQDVQRSKKKRHNRFLSKLEQVQLDAAKEHNKKVIDHKMRAFESRQRQQVQLWMVRNRFQEEQEKRFYNQWVTMKSLQHEKCDRHLYGLPEDLFGEPEHAVTLKNKQPKLIKTFDYREKRRKNKEAFKHYLDINAGIDFDTRDEMPKVEPPDNVDVNVRSHSGVRWKEDEKKVKEILRDAKQELRSDAATPPPKEQKAAPTRPPAKKQLKPPVRDYKPPAKAATNKPAYPTPASKENKTPANSSPQKGRSSNIKFVNPREQQKSKDTTSKQPSKPSNAQNRMAALAVPPKYNAQERKFPSMTSLKTVDFMNDGGSDTGSQLDAFERARIKYNLYMDSDNESVGP